MGERAQLLVQVRRRGRHGGTDLLQAPRHPHHPPLVAEVPLDLADDRGRGVGGELQAAPGLEAVQGVDEADAADLDQIAERLAAAVEAARDVLDDRQVAAHELVAQRGPPGRVRGHGRELAQHVADVLALVDGCPGRAIGCHDGVNGADGHIPVGAVGGGSVGVGDRRPDDADVVLTSARGVGGSVRSWSVRLGGRR